MNESGRPITYLCRCDFNEKENSHNIPPFYHTGRPRRVPDEISLSIIEIKFR